MYPDTGHNANFSQLQDETSNLPNTRVCVCVHVCCVCATIWQLNKHRHQGANQSATYIKYSHELNEGSTCAGTHLL